MSLLRQNTRVLLNCMIGTSKVEILRKFLKVKDFMQPCKDF